MEDKIPLDPRNKVYTFKDLTPKFIIRLREYFRKLKLKRYKNKKVKESKTAFQRNYHIKFKIHVLDEYNPQVSDTEYEMLIPAKAIFFAKRQLDKSIREKITVEVTKFEELNDEEHTEFLQSQKEYIAQKSK